MSRYNFTGMRKFVDKAAERLGYANLTFINKAYACWPISQIQDSIANLANKKDQASRESVFYNVKNARMALKVALTAADEAIEECRSEYNLAEPEWVEAERPISATETDDVNRPEPEAVANGRRAGKR
jgi:hypothetical protein